MPVTITAVIASDIRFPTSLALDGSDAMNLEPDYSAAYVVLETDHPDGLEGHGLTFTSGRGNELCVAAIEALAPLVVGRTLESFTADLGAFWSHIVGDSQLRWVGPEKGVIHLATGAIVNAVWDLYAKTEGKPLWKVIVDMTPEELVRCIPFRYITDALTPAEALDILRRNEPTKAAREAEMLATGYPGLHHLDRLARLPRRQGPSAVPRRESRRDGRISRSRSGVISKRTSGGRGSCATRSDRTGSSWSTPTRSGTSTRRSPGWSASHHSSHGGSRSRPARTTSSAMPGSPARSPRMASASRPASTATIG